MLIGHYSVAFAMKRFEPNLKLWWLFVAVQFVDILFTLAVFAGLEDFHLVWELPSNPLDLYYMPFTHSLTASIGWALLGFLALRHTTDLSRNSCVLIALAILSHWFVDLPVHRPDLPVYGNQLKLGFSLWNYPLLAYSAEIALLLGSVVYLATHSSSQHRKPLYALGAVLVLIQTGVTFGPVPTAKLVITASLLINFLLLTFLARVVDVRQNA